MLCVHAALFVSTRRAAVLVASPAAVSYSRRLHASLSTAHCAPPLALRARPQRNLLRSLTCVRVWSGVERGRSSSSSSSSSSGPTPGGDWSQMKRPFASTGAPAGGSVKWAKTSSGDPQDAGRGGSGPRPGGQPPGGSVGIGGRPPARPVPAAPQRPQLVAVPGAPLFSALAVSDKIKKAISDDLKFVTMTPVQAATLPIILSGQDVLAKAKTGTGKTLAFLVPTIEHLLQSPRPAGAIRALVLSPTRELATQTAVEAKALSAHCPGFRVAIVVGGNKPSSDAARLAGEVDILVATPGRLKDHCDNTPGFSARLKGTRILILDEGDQLLAAGFRPDIERILRHVNPSRQSLCFSATLPAELQAVLGTALRKDHKLMDCVGADDPDTHAAVDQSFGVLGIEDLLPVMVAQVALEMKDDPLAKVIVFFPTARQTQLGAELLNAMGVPALEIHSRKSQSKRDQAAAAFRAAKSALMCSSDVSARGVDYPDVTLVIQVGMPTNREQYIHRLGRTGRAGKQGRGLLLLAPYEASPVKTALAGLPLADATQALGGSVDATLRSSVGAAMGRVAPETRAQAYGAWLGFYNGMLGRFRWTKEELVRQANLLSRNVWAQPQPPPLAAKTVAMVRVSGPPGIFPLTC
jgi:ATP-dependent RNA helicase MSS116